MDVLRNLFGNVSATVLRLALVAGTLALVYVFAIRPVLDTTEEISRTTNNTIQQSVQQSIQQTQQQVRESFGHVGAPAGTGQIPSSIQIRRTVSGLTPAQANRLNRCLQRAASNLGAFNACFDRFEKRGRRR